MADGRGQAVQFFAMLSLLGPASGTGLRGIAHTDFTQVIDIEPGEETPAVYVRVRKAAEARYGSYLADHAMVSFNLLPLVLVPVPAVQLTGEN
jgi:hypothetical protein